MLLVLERLVAEDSRFAHHAILVAVVASVPSVVRAYWQYFFGVDTSDLFDTFRVTGFFSHPNLLALHLVLLLLVSVAVLPAVSRRRQLWLLAYMTVASGALFLTLSRTAWLALVCGLLLVGLIQQRALLAVLLAALPILFFAVPGIQSRFSDVDLAFVADGPPSPEEEFYPSNTFAWRVAYWGRVLPLAHGNELTGIGFETVAQRRAEAFPPHNEFLRAFVEMGVFGLVAFLAMLVACARTAWTGLKTARPGLERAFAVAFAACSLALAVRMPVENQLTDVSNLWLFAVVAAPVLARLAPPSAVSTPRRNRASAFS
ncbi:MAG: O-antigen ligase family protein, partial [Actinomycetota bacterium]|nr:O-antigen ligase family protein [Actinomycetota bacterium]